MGRQITQLIDERLAEIATQPLLPNKLKKQVSTQQETAVQVNKNTDIDVEETFDEEHDYEAASVANEEDDHTI
jgi:hypothetical protein